MIKANSGDDNKIIEAESEEEAYQKIEKEFGIKPVKVVILPKETEFEKVRIESDMKVAEFYYKYGDENIVYIINGDKSKNSIGIDREDEVIEQYSMKVKGITIEVKGCQLPATKATRYFAHFNYKEGEYFLLGIMNKKEFEEILNNLYFF